MIRETTTSQDLSLEGVFNDFYVVPDYQREYVWERKEVGQLLEDVYREFSATGGASEYYMGTLVVCPSANDSYEVIDGQQRLTTFFLMFCAIRAHLQEIGASPIATLDRKLAARLNGNNGHDPLRYRVILGYPDSATLLQTVAVGSSVEGIIPTTRSIENILNAYRDIRTFLRRQFGDGKIALEGFYSYLTENTKVVRIRTGSVAIALRLYESVNQRGVRLDAVDLLKSLMFVHTPREQFEQLRAKWKSLVDQLYANGAMMEEHQRDRQWRFLNYYLRNRFKQQDMKEEQLYPWISGHDGDVGYKTKPLAFVDDLLKAAYDIGR